jgi:multidrug resistance efflux pump
MKAILLTALLAAGQAAQSKTQPETVAQGTTARAEAATLALIEEADVPAASPGVLTDVTVKEGSLVQKGAPVAQVDDREAAGKLRAAQFELAAAEEDAKDDVNVRFAEASYNVAVAEVAQAKATRARAPQAVSDTDLRRLELNAEKSKLQIEVSQKEFIVAGITRDVKQAAVDLAQLEVTKMKITSPLDGVVVQRYKNLGEWAQAGDPIVRVVRMDRLRVEADFKADRYSPEQLMGRPVSVEVRLPGGRTERLQGHVTFVSPLVDLSGEFQVWAEVENREENGFWVLRPGLEAEMSVHLR